jgi:hypothetical protein
VTAVTVYRHRRSLADRLRPAARAIRRRIRGKGALVAEVGIIATVLPVGVAGVWVLWGMGWALLAVVPAGGALAYMVGPTPPQQGRRQG